MTTTERETPPAGEREEGPGIPAAPEGYDPLDLGYIANPHDALREMREDGRIHYRDAFLGRQVVLTHWDDVNELLRSKDVFKDSRKLPAGDIRRTGLLPDEDDHSDREPSILQLDLPEHHRLRRLVDRAFTPRAVDALNPHIEELADGLLDDVAGESEIDFMTAIAIPLPVIVISEMLGVDPEDSARFKEWSLTSVNSALDPTDKDRIRAGRAAQQAQRDYFDRAVTERRKDPRDDLMSALILAEDEGDKLTHGETLTMLGLLLAAGNLTTTDLLGNGLLTLLTHPQQYQRLREHPELTALAVNEMLRYTPPVLNTGRITTHQQELGGCPVDANVNVVASLMSANRDPQVFEHPDRFDIGREGTNFLSFGGGIHYCLGANLAKNEARITLERFFARYDHVELAVPPEEIEWRGGGAFRGLLSLPLRVS
ncbi:MAG: cytochrome P450 [Dehalococcoidia bacterium]